MTPWYLQPTGAAAEREAALAGIAHRLTAARCAARLLRSGAGAAREWALARAIERVLRAATRDVARLRRDRPSRPIDIFRHFVQS
jgi:hypothetical protein